MATEEMFDGFANDPYAEEAADRWGDTAVGAQRRAAGWGAQDRAAVRREQAEVHERLAAVKRAGRPVDSAEARAAVAAHHAWVSRFWTPDAAAYAGLGRMYVDDERFTATIDAYEPGLAVYLRDAIAAWSADA
ncbi:MAG: TipAS antibiotic-recognition domain-containing protein [Pseudonocardia sp.]|nr:TipAS antibiotic-recognition domain-containing protein [Pseudonocardia sp.]